MLELRSMSECDECYNFAVKVGHQMVRQTFCVYRFEGTAVSLFGHVTLCVCLEHVVVATHW